MAQFQVFSNRNLISYNSTHLHLLTCYFTDVISRYSGGRCVTYEVCGGLATSAADRAGNRAQVANHLAAAPLVFEWHPVREPVRALHLVRGCPGTYSSELTSKTVTRSGAVAISTSSSPAATPPSSSTRKQNPGWPPLGTLPKYRRRPRPCPKAVTPRHIGRGPISRMSQAPDL